jgi:sigma-B regulation protein RsbU (phosphoserine phosphatase)
MLRRAGPLLVSDFGDDNFITLFLGELDAASGRFAWCSAGHPPGWLFAPDGSLRAELPPAMPAIASALPFPEPEPRAVDIHPGETLVLLTDGVLEATGPSGEEFGEERARRTVARHAAAPPAELVRHLIEAVAAFRESEPQQDDVTVVVLRRT